MAAMLHLHTILLPTLLLVAFLLLDSAAADSEYRNNIRGGQSRSEKQPRRLVVEEAWTANVHNGTANEDEDEEESDTLLDADDGDDFYLVVAEVTTTQWGRPNNSSNTTAEESSSSPSTSTFPTVSPTTQFPTVLPTTALPTASPTTAFPSFAPTNKHASVASFVGDGGGINFPLQRCQGDCDRDADCAGPNLICHQRTSRSDPVPGCMLLDTVLLDATDICIDPFDMPSAAPTTSSAPTIAPTVAPTQKPTPVPTVTPTTLVPTQRPTEIPSTAPSWPYGVAVRVGNGGETPEVFPLQNCQGDCDNDNDCDGVLVCWQRDRATDPLPGCAGSLADGTDICVEPHVLPTAAPTMRPTPRPTFGPGQSFKVRMYWNNYYWQEEKFERPWCVTYDYPRSYCWYDSTTRRSCKSDEMYIDRCGEDRFKQEFELIQFGNDEALIKVAGEDRCWTRRNGLIKLEACDYFGGNDRQNFQARNGDFNSKRFELRNGGCVTTHHQPKEREVVQVDDCNAARSATANFWRLYD